MKTSLHLRPYVKPALAALAAGVATAVLSFTVLPVAAQSTSSTAKMAVTSDAGKLGRADRGMIRSLAQTHMAEIAVARLALEKSPSEEIKKFAQQMVDDHTSALADVQALATAKGAALPEGPGMLAKTKAAGMKALSGNLFDKEYAKYAGVNDHQASIRLLKKIQKDAKDADLKALAGKMLPEVERHLEMAKTLALPR